VFSLRNWSKQILQIAEIYIHNSVPHETDPALSGHNPYMRDTMLNVQKAGEVYRCNVCGNVVIVKEAGGGEMVCHGEPMQLVEPGGSKAQ
jgi:desulfoferrodoxin-like iron-binding protein